ncbi:MAG: hypothetical protein WCV00_13755 [Verrucomicrobiia bacterium]
MPKQPNQDPISQVEQAKSDAADLYNEAVKLIADLSRSADQRYRPWSECKSPQALQSALHARAILADALQILAKPAPIAPEAIELIAEAKDFIEFANRALAEVDEKLAAANSSYLTGKPVILVAEDEIGVAARLVYELERSIKTHEIRLVTQADQIPNALQRFAPQILLLDRKFDENQVEFYPDINKDLLISAFNFRKLYPKLNNTIVIVVSQWGEPAFQQRFNSEYNSQGIYYYPKIQGLQNLISWIQDTIIPGLPTYPPFLTST